MNPYHDLARDAGIDYLSEFVRHLDGLAREAWHERGVSPTVADGTHEPASLLGLIA